jgi:hypothetical protein
MAAPRERRSLYRYKHEKNWNDDDETKLARSFDHDTPRRCHRRHRRGHREWTSTFSIGIRRICQMRLIAFPLVGVATLAGVVALTAPAANQEGAPIFVTDIPPGYRDWRLISVAHEEGNLHSFAAVLGNDLAIQAYREGKVPFPDGAIIAALHYRHVPSEENNKAFGQAQSFVPGTPTNIQFMIKDTKKYTATGGWGFAHFQDGKPGDDAFMKTCFPCHNEVKARDLVFTRYAQ